MAEDELIEEDRDHRSPIKTDTNNKHTHITNDKPVTRSANVGYSMPLLYEYNIYCIL